jgi:hypothetical protein
MNNDFYKKLVDLYAGDELPEELASEMEAAAMADPELSHDMFTLKTTVQLLKQQDEPSFTEESFHRILMKMRTRGAEIEQRSPEPAHWQYRLPIQS